jgi:hypothetical protein
MEDISVTTGGEPAGVLVLIEIGKLRHNVNNMAAIRLVFTRGRLACSETILQRIGSFLDKSLLTPISGWLR